MLSSGQKAALDAIKVNVNRTFNYGRYEGEGLVDSDLTLELENGMASIHGSGMTIDELEYATAKLIAAFRKEVGHGRTEKPVA